MISFQEARQIAIDEINKHRAWGHDSLIIIDEKIIEKDYAWIFPYTSKMFLDTNDITHSITGNGPIFVSKFDGQVSKYQTGLSIDDMIDKYEEDNKIWCLLLTDDIFSDTNKALAFRETAGLTISEITCFKKNTTAAIAIGAWARLEKMQNQLSLKKIATILTLRAVTNKTKT